MPSARPAPRPARPPGRRPGVRRFRSAAALLIVAALVATSGSTLSTAPSGPGWASPGLVGGAGWPLVGVPLSPAEGPGAAYLPDSSVVRLANGQIRLVPSGTETPATVPPGDPQVAAAVRSDNSWLAHGTVPGSELRLGSAYQHHRSAEEYGDMAKRALLDLRLLTRPNGASLASWYGAWRYSWPRDSAFAAAAFTVTEHPAEARRVLRFLARVQHEDGLWAARYNADGTAVVDGRPPQLDSLGWVLWASWFYTARAPSPRDLPELWPMVQRAADHLAHSLDTEGLPPPSSDYWERDHRREQDPRRPTLGVVGPVLAGLRAAAAVADGYGVRGKAAQWRAAAHRLSDAVARQFTPYGYPRSPVRGGRMDTSVTFLAPPFAPLDPGVSGAVATAARKQALPNGGVLPGERWSGNKLVAWTPETALFALNAAASGRPDEALGRLDWLTEHRTTLGALPEKIGERGQPAGVAPLGWTASLVLLTLSALERPLPVLPVDNSPPPQARRPGWRP
ncbi:glycoside hydrolase family 15 [Actinomadura rubrisoli]|uniref:Glycoside hydrolase family 15 n=1 Tax=Actinomadura rubrisoli TaxID=2530368 RepID=A0A4R4ZYS1_9ACTN|nr:glycoside hydrolase family 15 [Actinomadura rubrisoli]